MGSESSRCMPGSTLSKMLSVLYESEFSSADILAECMEIGLDIILIV